MAIAVRNVNAGMGVRTRGHTFKERYHGNKAAVFGIPFPLGNGDSVFGMGRVMVHVGVKTYDFG